MSKKDSVWLVIACVLVAPVVVIRSLSALVAPANPNQITIDQLAKAGNGSYCVASLVHNGQGTGANFINVPTGEIDEEGKPVFQAVATTAPPGEQVLSIDKASSFMAESEDSSKCKSTKPTGNTQDSLESSGNIEDSRTGYCLSTSKKRKGVWMIYSGGSNMGYMRPLDRETEYIDENC